MDRINQYIDGMGAFLGGGFCHRLPERSFSVAGWQLPLCARCTGLYVGFIVSLLFFYFVLKRGKASAPPKILTGGLMSLCFLPLAVDGLTSYLGFRESSNILRFVTGVLFSTMLPPFLILLNNFDPWSQKDVPVVKNSVEVFLPGLFSMFFLAPVLGLSHENGILAQAAGGILSLIVLVCLPAAVYYIIRSLVRFFWPGLKGREAAGLSAFFGVVLFTVIKTVALIKKG